MESERKSEDDRSEEEGRRCGGKNNSSEGARSREQGQDESERTAKVGRMTIQFPNGEGLSVMDASGRGDGGVAVMDAPGRGDGGVGVHTDTYGGRTPEHRLDKHLDHLSLGETDAAVAHGNGHCTADDEDVDAASLSRPPSDTWAPPISETPSSFSPNLIPSFPLSSSFSPNLIPSFPLSSSSPNLIPSFPRSSSGSSLSITPSAAPSLSPPLPEGTEAEVLLAGARLALDVYKGGAGALPSLWEGHQEQLREVQYLRLGSEDQGALEGALVVLPKLTRLRSLAIRGHRFHDSEGAPLPGLLSSLPSSSLSSLSLLVHLDLSFNRLSALPVCVLSLRALAELVLCCNRIATLPGEMGALASSLRRLDLLGNRLASLPPALGRLRGLLVLDVSANQLLALPDELGEMSGLRTLELSQNRLRELPTSLGSLSSLRQLVVHSNNLRSIPECVRALPNLSLDLRNNPIGRPPTPPPLPPNPPAQEDTALPELHLGINQHRFTVTTDGCHVFIPGGAELLFPRRCVASVTRLKWVEHRLDKKWVWLEEHDFLLSRPLELLPHSISFKRPVEVCVPYRRVHQREVVVRKFDGQQWSTLPTLTRRGSQRHSSQPRGRPARLACCSVREFSWFVAVARLVSDSCSVPPEGALLVSRVDPGIKLRFPPEATTHTRIVTLQVLQVALSELQVLSGDLEACASPLLCLSQTPSMPFLQPIRVQVPLPPGLTGHMVDMSRLHLLHRDSASYTWSDITAQVSLQITQLYAIFTITHFSWYWLWYSTQKCISGVVRKVYHRLKQFRVQFLAQQKKSDPLQVLLQCLPACKVDGRLEALCDVYDGPQPSDVCDLLEGEQFFAGFERGIDINADRPDCMEGRLAFVFYSHLKNLKEVFICPSTGQQGQQGPTRGQVSFYRGEVPSDVPVEVQVKRKGHDSQWMATLPIRLPGPGCEGSSVFAEREYPPLNLGDPESGYLTETNLRAISDRIGLDWRNIGMNLGISYYKLEQMQNDHSHDLGGLILKMLFHWARAQQSEGAVPRLIDAMQESGRRDLAEEVKEIVSVGKRKYQASLKRVGLQEEPPPVSQSETSA